MSTADLTDWTIEENNVSGSGDLTDWTVDVAGITSGSNPSFGAITTYGSSGSTGVILTLPSPLTIGDILLAVAINNNTNSTFTVPAGFTQLDQSGLNTTGVTAYRVVNGAEASSYTFTNSLGSIACGGALLRYTTGGTMAVEDHAAWSNMITSTTFACPSVTATHTNDIDVLIAYGNTALFLSTVPPGATSRCNQTLAGGVNLYICDLPISATGATGTKIFTFASNQTGRTTSVLVH